MFISPAYAQDAASSVSPAGGMSGLLLPILLMLVVFYFLVIRPQSARIQEHSKMVKALQKGDKVITGGGLIATVVRLQGDDEIVLKLADGVEVTAVRSTVMAMRTPPEQKK